MASRKWRIIGGVGAAITVALGGSWLGDLMVPIRYPGRSAYQVPGLEEPVVDLAAIQRSWPGGMAEPGSRPRLIGYMNRIDRMAMPARAPAATASPQPVADLGTLLASADPAKGKRTAQLCASCHTFEQGGANRTGPNLWAVVGRDIASHAGFAYSGALTGQPGAWTYESLDRFLAGPARTIPGTKMAFAGVRNPGDRASLLAYLGSLSAAPAPFPPPMAADAKSPGVSAGAASSSGSGS